MKVIYIKHQSMTTLMKHSCFQQELLLRQLKHLELDSCLPYEALLTRGKVKLRHEERFTITTLRQVLRKLATFFRIYAS